MKKRKLKVRLVKLRVLILPDTVFEKNFGEKEWAFWDDRNQAIALRESRKGLKRLSDFLHEMKHVWVDLIDDEND